MNRFAILAMLVLLLAACTADAPTDADPTADATLIQANLPRQLDPAVDAAQIAQLTAGNNQFAFYLYHAIRATDDGNLIYSPYSVSLAFSMVYAGARGQTEAEMAQVLHFLPQDVHHLTFNALDQRLAALGAGDDDGRFQLNIANAVWGQIGLPFNEAYLEILAQQYGAGLRASDFVQQPDAARQEINDWIADQTADRIKDMLAPGVIDSATRLVLANAIYFNAAWRVPFNADQTENGPFTLLDGRQVAVPLMRQYAARILYAEGEGYQVGVLPYSSDGVQMVVILPNEGEFAAVEAALTADFIAQARRQAEMRDTRLTMPRFEFDADLDLQQLLISLGMTDAFSGAANFNGIVEGGGLYISDALHRGTITVNEEGTEAAAATVIVMAESAMEPAELSLDRPFIFAIVAGETGDILFLGRVVDPS
jgi:serpin B